MITETFDNHSPAKINLQRNENAPKVDAVIFTFSHVIEEYVIKNFNCREVGAMWMATGKTPVYCIDYNGKKFGFYKTYVGAPACAAQVEEVLTLFDTDKIIHFGGSGCLNKEIARGKVMVPTEAYRDEGTSYHYAPASDYIRINNSAKVVAFMEENRIPYALGKTWSTDAFYRETEDNFQRRKADGCISVEMEGAAVQAVCDFRGVQLYMFFTSGDLLDAPEWNSRWPDDNKGTQHDSGHFNIAISLAEYVATHC